MSLDAELAALEARFGAHLGVWALATGTNHAVEYNADQRFGFASAHKAFSAAAILRDSTAEQLSEVVQYSPQDITAAGYSPVTEQHVNEGMTLEALAEAAVRYSDNVAGNILLSKLGGPNGFTTFFRSLGDTVSRSDRIEPALNSAVPGDERDTSTPRAFGSDLRDVVLGSTLTEERRNTLKDWLVLNTTGDATIRAGVPSGWLVGDKTGTGKYGTRNDIAVIWPPDTAPIVIAIMTSKNDPDAQPDNALLAEAAKTVLDSLQQ